MKKYFALLLLCFAITQTSNAYARGSMHFGEKETIKKIEDTNLKGPKGEALFIGHKYSQYFFILGANFTDQGYVLGIKGVESYYPMPEGEKLSALQKIGALPTPLPAYKIEPIEYIMGYSLYILILVIGGWTFLKVKIKGTKKGNNQSPHQGASNGQNTTNPLAQVQIAANQLVQQLSTTLKSTNTKEGEQAESLIVILSSLAGFSCQMAVREAIIKKGGIPFEQALTTIETKDGAQFFTGDVLYDPLIKTQHSVYSIVGGGVQQLTQIEALDLNEIITHVTSTIGGENFGIPRLPEGYHAADDTPINYIKRFWPEFFPFIEKNCSNPLQWHILFSLALQNVIVKNKNEINPNSAFKVIMEIAISMSKIDPDILKKSA